MIWYIWKQCYVSISEPDWIEWSVLNSQNSDPVLLLVSTYLSVSEVVLAEFLPQKPVLSEGPQLGAHLAQADQVPAIRQTLHDVQLQAGRQVRQCHACRCGLEKKK